MSMREHLLGVQASLWTEFCEKEEDVDYLLFPRLGAIAEAVWSVPMSKKWERFLLALDDYQERWEMKGIRPSQSMFNVQHEVVSDYGSFKVSLECIRPDVEIRYTTDGREPDRFSSQYWRPLTLKEAKVVKCATFKNGKKKGQTLVLPIHKKGMPVKNLLRSNHVERRVMNGVRGTLKNTDGEWASWTKNDSIALVFDVGGRKRLERISFGVLNDFGLGIHKPKKVEVWLSDNEMLYWKLAEKEYDEAEIFREGRFVEDLKFELGDMARYVRLVVRGVGECPEWHVRPGLEVQIYIDEVSIE
jgi:hexosaminidase